MATRPAPNFPTPASAALATTPPAKPTTKSPACSRSAIRADPILDQLAAHGDPKAVRFGEPKMKSNPHDFSFSGIKTAMLYHLRRHPELQPEIDARQQALARGERTADALRQLSSRATLDLIASFQRAVVDDLTTRTLAAAEQYDVRTVLVSGGVAANRELRATFESEARRRSIERLLPQPRPLHRQRRHDRRRRPPALPQRRLRRLHP